MDNSGVTLREFLFTFVEEAYNANPLSIMAPHLINAPVSIGVQRGSTGDEANYVYVVNGDGTMAVLNTLRSESILAWTSWVFFSARILLETLFVAAIPLGVILFIDHFWVRMPLAAVSATPVYAYLKMASFKFFLFTYGRFHLVREEYREYFKESPTV